MKKTSTSKLGFKSFNLETKHFVIQFPCVFEVSGRLHFWTHGSSKISARQNLHVAKIPGGKNSARRNFCTSYISFGKFFTGQNFLSAKLQAKFPAAKYSSR